MSGVGSPQPPQVPISTFEKWVDKIMRFVGPLALAYIATLATNNHNRGEEIEKKVETVAVAAQTAADKTTEVKEASEKRDEKVAQKLADDTEVSRILLYGNWKYLDENAITTKDKEKASDAKMLYDAFEKKHPKKKP